MIEFSNLTAALAAAVGLVVLAVGRVPIPGRGMVRGVLVRLAGAVLLLPWPAGQGLAIVARAAREMDGNSPDQPETVQLLTAFVQLVLLGGAGVISLVLVLVAALAGEPRRRQDQPDGIMPRRSYRG